MSLDCDTDNYTRVYRLIMAAWGSQAIRCLAELSVAEHLENEPLSAQDIAKRESVDSAMLYRVLRTGVALGLLDHNNKDGKFSATPLLGILHKDAPESLKFFAQAAMGPAFWLPGGRTPQAVAQGDSQIVAALGEGLWEYYASHPEEGRMFSAAMTDLSTPVIREAVSVIDPCAAKYVVDIGGANGIFISELVERHSQLAGAVFDLPHVVPGAVEEAERRGLTHRVSGIAGDFTESVPESDIYLLKFILHDWDDRTCVTLLRNIRRAMNPGARLFIVEMVIENLTATVDAALLDMVMLFALSGQERDMSQFEALLSQAGMRAVSVKNLRGDYHLIEAVAELPELSRQ